MAVTAAARGKGAGTAMLRWSESIARERGATRLSLGVVRGNPAIRLYERFGFVRTSGFRPDMDCMITCMMGCPHWRNGGCGGYMMEKPL
jgi:ribosomal protein S18 acetylase RimI-like enzyme